MGMSHTVASRLFYAYLAASVTGFVVSRPELAIPAELREFLNVVHGFLYWGHIGAHLMASILDRLVRK